MRASQKSKQQTAPTMISAAPSIPAESFSISEVAKRLGIKQDLAISLFEEEPGVLDLSAPQKHGKRRKRCLRIPRHVFERVVRERTVRYNLRAQPERGGVNA